MTTQEQSVPKYFSDFVQENARQHQELADRISGVEVALTARISGVETNLGNRIGGIEGELRVIKAVSVAIFAAVAVAVIKYVFGL